MRHSEGSEQLQGWRGMSEAMTHQFLRLSLASSWAPTSNVIPLLVGGVLLILPTSRLPSCMHTHTHTNSHSNQNYMTLGALLRNTDCVSPKTQCDYQELYRQSCSQPCLSQVITNNYFTRRLRQITALHLCSNFGVKKPNSPLPLQASRTLMQCRLGKDITSVNIHKLKITDVVLQNNTAVSKGKLTHILRWAMPLKWWWNV